MVAVYLGLIVALIPAFNEEHYVASMLVRLSGLVYIVTFQPRKRRLLLNLPWGAGGAVVYAFNKQRL